MVIIIKNKVNTLTSKEKITQKVLFFIKILLIISTLIFPLFINIMSGIGWISTYSKYGGEFTICGVIMIVSSVLMAAATIFCLCKFNISAAVSGSLGFITAMVILYKMMYYADERGWSDRFTMQPASDIYRNRILPTIIPFIFLIAAVVIQYFSYDEKVKRKLRREEKERKENMPAPKILGE